MISAALLTIVILSASAGDVTPRQRIERAKVAEAELEYADAAEELLAVITDPNASEEELLEANLISGVMQRILRNDTQARLHFLYVLRRRPNTRLPASYPPKILAFFDLVREEVGGTSAKAPPPSLDVKEDNTPTNDSGSILSAPIPTATAARVRPEAAEEIVRDGVQPSSQVSSYSERKEPGSAEALSNALPSDDDNSKKNASLDATDPTLEDDDRDIPWPAIFGGGILAAAGTGIAVAAVGGAFALDSVFYNPNQGTAQRESVRLVSRALVATSVVGAIASMGGVGLIAIGWVE